LRIYLLMFIKTLIKTRIFLDFIDFSNKLT
jgi:hypothetical protein